MNMYSMSIVTKYMCIVYVKNYNIAMIVNFLPRDVMRKRGVRRLFVRLSRSCILSKKK